jgi:hypothetical protein
MYKDLESDFTDIKSTEPVFMSKGSISEIVKFLPKIVTEAKNLKPDLRRLLEEYHNLNQLTSSDMIMQHFEVVRSQMNQMLQQFGQGEVTG